MSECSGQSCDHPSHAQKEALKELMPVPIPVAEVPVREPRVSRRRVCMFRLAKFAQEHTGPFSPLVRDNKIVDWRCACGAFNSDVEGDYPIIEAMAKYQALKQEALEKQREKQEEMIEIARDAEAKKEAEKPNKKPLYTQLEISRIRAEVARSSRAKPWKRQKNKRHVSGKTLQERIAKKKGVYTFSKNV